MIYLRGIHKSNTGKQKRSDIMNKEKDKDSLRICTYVHDLMFSGLIPNDIPHLCQLGFTSLYLTVTYQYV